MNNKNFLTMKRGQAGFTLVELIVVIAILAILGGVAVPAYSGYVEKAERAADEQLLAELNTAFAAACAISGESHVGRNDATANIDPDTKEASVSTKINGFKDTFESFYEGGEFKKITELKYSFASGMFYDPSAKGTVTFQYGGATLTVPQEYIDLIEGSTFLNADTLGGTDGLLDKIADVSDFASVIIGQGGNAGKLLDNVIGSSEFQVFAAQALGIDPSDTAAFAAKDAELIAALKKDPANAGLSDDALRNKYMTNAAVLYAANQATQMSKDDIMASLKNQDVKQNIIDTMDTNTTSAFSQATLAFGMYTAWAHATGNTEAQGKDELDVMNDLNNAEFQAWLDSPQASNDLDAYLAALRVVDTNSKDAGAVSDLVVNGFGDSTLKDAVGGLFG